MELGLFWGITIITGAFAQYLLTIIFTMLYNLRKN